MQKFSNFNVFFEKSAFLLDIYCSHPEISTNYPPILDRLLCVVFNFLNRGLSQIARIMPTLCLNRGLRGRRGFRGWGLVR